jgi:hypothetical protein
MFTGPESFMLTTEASFEIPPEIANWRPQVGVLSEEGVRLVSEVTNWFDGPHLIEIARDGIDLMSDIPPGAVPPKGVCMWQAKSEEEEKYMKEVIIEKGISAGHMRVAKKEEIPYLNVFPTFLLFKRPGKYRDVINFKAVLDLFRWGRENISFNDATPLERRPSISPGRIKDAFHMLELMLRAGIERTAIRVSKLDIAEAYKHVRIAVKAQGQQCFRVYSNTYISLRMQFGTAASASIWCRLMNMVDYAFHLFGLGTISYFDDILLISISPGCAVRGLRLIRAILRCLGMKVNEEKSSTHGERQCEFLGIEIDLEKWCARIMNKTMDKLRARCSELRAICEEQKIRESESGLSEVRKMEAPDEPDAEVMVEDEETLDEVAMFMEEEGSEVKRESVRRIAQRIAGGLNFACQIIRSMKPVRSHFHWLSRVGRMWNRVATEHYVKMVEKLMDTHNWSRIVHLPFEREKQHDTQMATDSSDYAMGAIAMDRGGNAFYIMERWEDIDEAFKDLHINDKELLAHIIAVELLRCEVGKDYIVIDTLIDNQVAESWIKRLFAKLDTEGDISQRIRLEWLIDYAVYQQNHGIIVSTRYVKSELNVIPDALSRFETHWHIMTSFMDQVLGRGKACTRVRVRRGWQPARA